MPVTSREELINYCFRALGAPVLEINVSVEQADDRIDEAIQYYQFFHKDATEKVFYKHTITQADLDNGYITLPDELISVTRYIRSNQYGSNSNVFSADWQFTAATISELSSGSVVNYYIGHQYLGLLEKMINNMPITSFSRHMDRIKIHSDDYNPALNEYVILEGYQLINPETFPDVYNDHFLKRYSTALIKRQWGINMKKFEGMQLPGGVTTNGQAIFDEAQAEISQLEEEMRSTWEEPIDFMIG